MPKIPFTRGTHIRELLVKAISVFLVLSFTLVPYNAAATPNAKSSDAAPSNKVIFFVSDGMRQDLAESYISQGLMPSMAKLLRSGAEAADGGLLTEAPPNTGSGWFSLATGAWSGSATR